jgi:hypothetical protein
MTEDAAIRIDQTTMQSVYTCTQLGMAPGGDQPTEPTLPCELSVVTVSSCIRPSKRSPSQRELHRNCEMPTCGHMRVALRGWSHSHLSPTDTLYPAGRYGSNSGFTMTAAPAIGDGNKVAVTRSRLDIGGAHVVRRPPQHPSGKGEGLTCFRGSGGLVASRCVAKGQGFGTGTSGSPTGGLLFSSPPASPSPPLLSPFLFFTNNGSAAPEWASRRLRPPVRLLHSSHLPLLLWIAVAARRKTPRGF